MDEEETAKPRGLNDPGAEAKEAHTRTMTTTETTTSAATEAEMGPHALPKFRASVVPPSPTHNHSTSSEHLTPSNLRVSKTSDLLHPESLAFEVDPMLISRPERSFSISQGVMQTSRQSAGSINSLPKETTTTTARRRASQDYFTPLSQTHIPICGIVAGGDKWTLHQVYACVHTNNCPIVVVRVGEIPDPPLSVSWEQLVIYQNVLTRGKEAFSGATASFNLTHGILTSPWI
ncbi:unnamed protein product [Schistocephalus solidus]|uniref:LSDAT_euk domain-containing protein n=1 Tax=Schistocephalus solidus TaxID=70667 RepID=A0A183TQG8_SCHSO|nr:unnamed protein product [Schistocephalus solidus]